MPKTAITKLPAEPLTELQIIHRMVETGHGIDQIDKMVALAEHMAAKKAEAAYNRDMAACQAELPVIPKSKQGAVSKYAPYEELMILIKPIISKHGFSLTFSEPEEAQAEPGKLRGYLDVRHCEGHTVRHWGTFTRDPGNKAMSGTQADGSTWSYFRRYMVKNAFNIAEADEDRDGNFLSLETLLEPEQSILSDLLTLKKPNLERFWAWVNEMHKNPTEPITTVAEIVRWHFPVIRDMLQKVKEKHA